MRNKIDAESAPGLILALFNENPSWVLLIDKWALQGSGITEPDTLGNWPVSTVSVIADTSKCQIVTLERDLPDYPLRYLKAVIGGDMIDPVLAITDSMRVADSLFMLDQ
ncbi:MAG TPA: hypothetical protein VM123_16435 [archaeon]|nr:hypothetical protein [archaeon]